MELTCRAARLGAVGDQKGIDREGQGISQEDLRQLPDCPAQGKSTGHLQSGSEA
jgi:hypothetical protein